MKHKKKIKLFILNALLASGKTYLLNEVLKDQEFNLPQIDKAYFYCELGLQKPRVPETYLVYSYSPAELLCDIKTFLAEQQENNSNNDVYIFIEYNGSWPLSSFLINLKKDLNLRADEILYLLLPEKYDREKLEFGDFYHEGLKQASVILIPTTNDLRSDDLLMTVKKTYHQAKIISAADWSTLISSLKNIFITSKSSTLISWLYFACFIWAFFLARNFLQLPSFGNVFLYLKNFSTSFISLCLQIAPFILLSAFVSAVLQFFINENIFIKLTKKPMYIILPSFMLLSFIMPVCDCGLIPVSTRLVKKGLALEYALFFFFSSCILNPLVLASTYFAFPNQPELLLYRLIFGLLLALFLFAIIRRNSFSLFYIDKDESKKLYCQAGDNFLLDNSVFTTSKFQNSLFNKADMLFTHCTNEFFLMMKTLIPAIALTCILKLVISISDLSLIFANFSWFNLLGMRLLFMVIALIFLGVCANANAFIAKNFAQILGMPYMILYMILSPLVDLKNVLLLKQGFGFKILKSYLLIILLVFIALFILFAVIPTSFFPQNIVFN